MDIEPIPFYYDSINRNAIVVKPKKPFIDWVNSNYKDSISIDEKYENNIYLMRVQYNNDAVLSWLKNNFHDIFNNELNDWITDESMWPANRTYELFMEWFDIDVSSVIMDIEDFEITKD